MSAGSEAAERMLAEKETLARALGEALYERRPELLERYGEYGRAKCHEDMRYNVEHLAPAVDLGDAELFAGYVRWLEGLLRARGVDSRDITDTLELMDDLFRQRFTAEQHAAIEQSLRAGLEVLRPAPEAQ